MRWQDIDGDWWTIAGNPDLGAYNREDQEPLDFAIWQAADQTWQMVACCRKTGCGGKGRLFHRWQSDSLLQENWTPMGIFMEADPSFGETIGGLQAPNVIKHNGEYFMFYGDWVNICMAWSSDGKTFARLLGDNKLSRIFTKGDTLSNRDPNVMVFRNTYFLYHTEIADDQGRILCRKSDDLRKWGDAVVVNCGGSAGSGTSDAECPFVIHLEENQLFYLFRAHTRSDGEGYETSVYCSPDPLKFGVDSDEFKVTSLPLEAARLIEHDGQFYISALKPDLTGMMMAKLNWVRP
jgi:hypothetical protein